jgi:hypothetical protein
MTSSMFMSYYTCILKPHDTGDSTVPVYSQISRYFCQHHLPSVYIGILPVILAISKFLNIFMSFWRKYFTYPTLFLFYYPIFPLHKLVSLQNTFFSKKIKNDRCWRHSASITCHLTFWHHFWREKFNLWRPLVHIK